jgi:tungstate transport system substrate-binding protein
MLRFLLFIPLAFLSFICFAADKNRLLLATTTSTDNSGLLEKINPLFEDRYGIELNVVAVGSGKAIRLARNGDVDLILVHAPDEEEQLVEDGFGIERLPIMKNDYVLIGPKDDPADIKGSKNISEALSKLINANQTFISRGDDSGTHKKENNLWQAMGIIPKGSWYLSVGQAMGQTIIIANEKQAYTLTDRGTYLAYKDRIELNIIFEDKNELSNPYHVILVSPEKYPHINVNLARDYSNFLRSESVKSIIRNYKLHEEILFYPY